MACDPEELCEECPEWIFTLADLLMCMMGLFVILWVLKPNATANAEQATREEIRQQEMIRDIQIAFGATLDEESEVEMRLEELLRKLDQIKRNGEGEKGNAVTESQGADGTDPEVTRIREGDLAGVGGRVSFAAGATALDEAHQGDLRQIADRIRGHRNIVLVKGHASPDELAAAGTDDAIGLSLKRARAVADFLVSQGVNPEVLRVQGCGIYEPMRLRAYTEEDRLVNRRVEVEATDQLVGAFQDVPILAPL